MKEHWKTYKLGEIAEIDMGQSPKGDTCNEHGEGIPLLNGPTEFGTHFPTPVQYTTDPKKISSVDDILFCVRGSTTGRMNWSNREYAIGRGLAAIRHKEGSNYKYFLRGLIDINLKNILGLTTGSTFPNIGGNQLKEFKVNAPSLFIQTRIAAILSSLDHKIELNLRMNQTLEAMAQNIFREWFEGASDVPLSEYIEVNPKLSLKKGSLVKYVEMSDLPTTGSSINSFIVRAFTSGSKFQNNDTLVARITPCLENGKTGFVDFLSSNDEIAYGSTEFIVLRAKAFISPYYVYLLSRDENFRAYAIKSMVGTSGRQRVQTDILNSFGVPHATLDKMNHFHVVVSSFFKKIKINSKENQTLTRLRDSLLPRLMSGRITV